MFIFRFHNSFSLTRQKKKDKREKTKILDTKILNKNNNQQQQKKKQKPKRIAIMKNNFRDKDKVYDSTILKESQTGVKRLVKTASFLIIAQIALHMPLIHNNNLPSRIFSYLMVTYWSLSGLDCSWNKP